MLPLMIWTMATRYLHKILLNFFVPFDIPFLCFGSWLRFLCVLFPFLEFFFGVFWIDCAL
ncbi:hypothetical protein ZEAMMB73_Zm00001d003636 [Zea mays]|uniref:Uncharacterized protein n=1 Tax=Zea mays TaxID=4577 RepID=A0A1D6EAA7_MAIZE|nr:hypothetical protein ZEAMMB73_Zm00001d003636 [Zea mays]